MVLRPESLSNPHHEHELPQARCAAFNHALSLCKFVSIALYLCFVRFSFFYACWLEQENERTSGTLGGGLKGGARPPKGSKSKAQLAKARKTKASKNLEQQVIVFAHAVP